MIAKNVVKRKDTTVELTGKMSAKIARTIHLKVARIKPYNRWKNIG